MSRPESLAKLRAPLGGQEIELQQLEFEGGMSLLRTRIRERSRFTVFDIDPVTAEQWGQALLAWARSQPAKDADVSSSRPAGDALTPALSQGEAECTGTGTPSEHALPPALPRGERV